MISNKDILKQVQRRGSIETYAVRVWTRDEVEVACSDLIEEHKIDFAELSDEDKDEILKRFQTYGDLNMFNDMTWKTLKNIVKDFIEEHDEY